MPTPTSPIVWAVCAAARVALQFRDDLRWLRRGDGELDVRRRLDGVGIGILGLLAAIALWLSRPRRVDSLALSSRRQVGERLS